jgi:hypothetical protein
LSFNIWHRTQAGLAGVDIDFVEICTKCQKPVAFLELVRDNGNNRVDIYNKCDLITSYIAWNMHRPSYVVFYTPNETSDSILSVKVKQSRPEPGKVVEMSANAWAHYLRYLHKDHTMICKKQRKGVVSEAERSVRLQSKEWLELDVTPTTYGEDEIAVYAAKVGEQYIEAKFGPLGGGLENLYGAVLRHVVEAMEATMRTWTRGAFAPLPVELVAQLNEAGDKVVGAIRIN